MIPLSKVLNPQGSPWPREEFPTLFEKVASSLFERLEEEPPGRERYAVAAKSGAYGSYRAVTQGLASFDPTTIEDREERLAFWVNLHNGLIAEALIRLVSKKIPFPLKLVARKARYLVGPYRLSACEIRDGILRGNRPAPRSFLLPFGSFDPRRRLCLPNPDPRVHFVLFTGARSGPRPTTLRPGKVEHFLEEATRCALNGPDVEWDGPTRTLRLPRVFFWFGRDFGQKEGIASFVVPYLEDEGAKVLIMKHPRKVQVRYGMYNWEPA